MKSAYTVSKMAIAENNITFAILAILFGLSLMLNLRLGYLIRSGGAPGAHTQTALLHAVEATTGGRPELSHLIDTSGKPFKIDTTKTTLIYYFSPTCGWCKLNRPSIISLAKQIEPRHNYEIIGMTQSSTGLSDYLVKHPMPFKVVVDGDPYDISTMDLRGTPQTVEIAGGKVIHNWSGAYQLNVKDSIQHELDLSLPDFVTGTKTNLLAAH